MICLGCCNCYCWDRVSVFCTKLFSSAARKFSEVINDPVPVAEAFAFELLLPTEEAFPTGLLLFAMRLGSKIYLRFLSLFLSPPLRVAPSDGCFSSVSYD